MDNLFILLVLASLVLLIIGLFKPTTSLFWDKKERTRKKSALIYGGLTILFFILFGITIDRKQIDTASNKESQTIVSSTKKVDGDNAKNFAEPSSTTEKEDRSSSEKTREQLIRELASFEKPYDNTSFQGTIESVQMGLILYAAYGKIISKGKESPDEENKKLADQLQKKVAARQTKEFPILRKNYVKVAAENLWESNIYMTTSGSNNSIINLTGGLFASNKNIAETQKTLLEIFTQFRFKEIQYRWYKEADEFTFYNWKHQKTPTQ